MDYQYLAKHDGSEQAAGRGSGADVHPDAQQRPYPRTPYLNMVYAPMERRLDTAIFRALFASSTRQARQFVVLGYVKVNGKKVGRLPSSGQSSADILCQMIYPGYQLNPGDMFQVEPDRVLYATGAPKDSAERRAGRQFRARAIKKRRAASSKSEDDASDITEKEAEAPQPEADKLSPEEQVKQKKAELKDLLHQAKTLLSTPSTSLSAKRKQDLRTFQRTVRRTIARPGSLPTDALDAQLAEITARLTTPNVPQPAQAPTPAATPNDDMPELSTPALRAEMETLSPEQLRTLRRALIEAKENPVDASKPYATPWQPRQFMSAFAFVPRYLEVHPKVCSAVYIRHPVARPGLAEVPTPFGAETLALSHNWYLRRR